MLREEDGHSFRFRGGIAIGISQWWHWNFPWPLCSLEISATTLGLAYFGKVRHLKREHIKSLEAVSYFLVPGIQIRHSDPETPAYVFFTTISSKPILAHAEYLGFPVLK